MTVRVVELLKSVHVEHEYRECSEVALGPLDLQIELILGRLMIEQPGEAVGHRFVPVAEHLMPDANALESHGRLWDERGKPRHLLPCKRMLPGPDELRDPKWSPQVGERVEKPALAFPFG